jgi:protein O-GlcNAc transferase
MTSPSHLFHEAVTAHSGGEFQKAASLYRQLLETDPNHAGVLNNLGALYLQEGGLDSAAACYQKAFRINPRNPDLCNNLGILALKQGDPNRARSYYETALDLKPNDPEILNNLGVALKEMGRIEAAVDLYRRSVALNPAYGKAYVNLGIACRETGKIDDAVASYTRALELDPADPEIHYNLGDALEARGEFEEALDCQKRALEIGKDSVALRVGAARIMIDCGDWTSAKPLLRKCLAHDFSVYELPLLRHLLLYLNAYPMAPKEIFRMHALCGDLILRQFRNRTRALDFDFEGLRPRRGRIRVGYVSPDFRRHSVGWFFREILARHDRDSFEVFCYALSPGEDDLTSAIRTAAACFKDVSRLSSEDIAGEIHGDGIQILVDLAGYTRNNRIEVFAMKPAPVQVTAIGYPNGTGLPTVDYRLTDRWADDEGAFRYYREKLIRLPRCFLPFPDLGVSQKRIRKSDHGIPEGGFVFASFNARHKLNPDVLRLWNRIMTSLPGAYLAFSFHHTESEFARKGVRSFFPTAADRLVFLPRVETEEEHRARYRLADAALDPFPYCGTTTSYEALWMGVPVITLVGRNHVQRTTFSLLKNLGLEETAAFSGEEYVKRAVELAKDPQRLDVLRAGIRDRLHAPLENHLKEYVLDLEGAYRRIWEQYQKGLGPQPPDSGGGDRT